MKTAITFKPHVSLNVSNIDASVHFYRALFGVEPVKHYHHETTTHSVLLDDQGGDSRQRRTGYAKFDLQNPGLNFVLNEMMENHRGGALSHLGLQVADTAAVLQLRERAIALGMQPRDEMSVSCCYARQDKFWLSDPDGNEWEVFTVIENLTPEQLQTISAQCEVSACKTADTTTATTECAKACG
jgi:catechol 2,3-dioxygenase-like lactoylglutathione lyase family enzyme